MLVVGAGVAGLTAALACRAQGFDPVVVASSGAERESATAPRALTLWHPAASLLEWLVPAALEVAVPVTGWVVSWPDTPDRERFCAPDDCETPFVRLSRASVREALAGAIPDARLRTGTAPRAFESAGTDTVVTFADGVRERFDLVVGAGGRASRVRATCLDADVEDGVRWGTYHGAARLADRSVVHESWCREGSLARLGPLSDADAGRYVEAADRSPGTTEWTGAGVALVGAAAHPLPPSALVADSLAVEDGVSLATALATRPTTRGALRTYERWRGARVDRLSDPTGAGEPWPEVARHNRAFLRRVFE